MGFIFPNYTFSSVTDIDKIIFKEKKLIILDVDNTMFYCETSRSTPNRLSWLQALKKGRTCVFLSNSNSIEKRKKNISQMTGCEVFVSSHKKPSRKVFKELQEAYKIPAEKIMIIGDLRITDIWFGNRTGMTTVLVDPLGKDTLFKVWFARVIGNILAFIVPNF
mgnify:CR=1 FL=1|jgi:uncharacterized protein